MALTPFVAGWHVPGVVAALCCVSVILLAVPILWRSREKVTPLKGMMIFLAIAFIATASFLLISHIMSLPILASWPPSQEDRVSLWFILV